MTNHQEDMFVKILYAFLPFLSLDEGLANGSHPERNPQNPIAFLQFPTPTTCGKIPQNHQQPSSHSDSSRCVPVHFSLLVSRCLIGAQVLM
jgi:hypothetical protein